MAFIVKILCKFCHFLPGQSRQPRGEGDRQRKGELRGKVLDLRGGDLLRAELGGLAGVGADVLLEDEGVGVLLVADRALVEHPHRRLRPGGRVGTGYQWGGLYCRGSL